jgi:phospholipid/cholesterol/gamma-HCH transport system permease protein
MAPTIEFAFHESESDGATLALSGTLTIASVGGLDRALRGPLLGHAPFSRLDLSAVEAIDTAGAWLAWRLADRAGARITGASPDAQRLIATVSRGGEFTPDQALPVEPVKQLLAGTGGMVLRGMAGMRLMLGFYGELLVALWGLLLHPSRIRWTAIVRQGQLVGVEAIAIVGLMSFLVGVVIAQQGAVQLTQFGAEIYTVNLTGRISLRELGILMTAIMVAGRSGSAFAAQIGTMKLTEEVDAMRTIGISPMEALVLPRVLAAVVMMPLLGIYAALVAIVGGATISSFTLDIPFWTFLARVQEVVPLVDFWVGAIKGPVFGFIVALTGCYQGMQVSGNSEEVGTRTTAAVVQAIFAVIVLDAFFAVFFSMVGWI